MPAEAGRSWRCVRLSACRGHRQHHICKTKTRPEFAVCEATVWGRRVALKHSDSDGASPRIGQEPKTIAAAGFISAETASAARPCQNADPRWPVRGVTRTSPVLAILRPKPFCYTALVGSSTKFSVMKDADTQVKAIFIEVGKIFKDPRSSLAQPGPPPAADYVKKWHEFESLAKTAEPSTNSKQASSPVKSSRPSS